MRESRLSVCMCACVGGGGEGVGRSGAECMNCYRKVAPPEPFSPGLDGAVCLMAAAQIGSGYDGAGLS